MIAIPVSRLPYIGLLLAVLAPASAFGAGPAQRVDGTLRDATGFVGYVDPAQLAETALADWPGALARVLSDDPLTGRRALQVRFPAGWTRPNNAAAPQAQSIEIVMLEGVFQFGDERLGKYDFAFVPPGSSPPRLAAAAPEGARALLFFDPPAPDAAAVIRQRERGTYVTRFDPARWQTGAVPTIKVMYLKNDPFTTARTSYVRIEAGTPQGGMLQGPAKAFWEEHSVAEEGVLMEGRRTLAECLPDRTVVGVYGPEGYYWRPPGIPHGGPESGPVPGSPPQIWLQRSSVVLDFKYYGSCDGGRGSAPVATPSFLKR